MPPLYPRTRQPCPLPGLPREGGASPHSHYLLRSHGERCGRSLGSARLAAAPRRRGAEGPALSSLPHPAALRLEPLAQPAPQKCINSNHIMINSSVPVTRGGGTRRGAGAGERQGARERPFHRSSAPGAGLRQRGGCAELPVPCQVCGGGVLRAGDRAISPPPRRHPGLPGRREPTRAPPARGSC